MRVIIAHNALQPGARADEQDVLIQVGVVQAALAELGHTSEIIPVDLNLAAFDRRLKEQRPDVVFNLIESVADSDRLASLAVAVIEEAGIPCTGSSSMGLWLTNHKTLTKERLKLAGLPTPDWFDPAGNMEFFSIQSGDRFILKPVGEHASLGMDENAIVQPRHVEDLADLVEQQAQRINRACFAERFIAGRELNVSLLASSDGCEVLPLAEIDFSAFPPEKPRIVDYRAKWDPQSFEFQNTPRKFLSRTQDAALTRQLADAASACWRAFQLAGYARVDFRVDESGQSWILEINTNPCLSPDAGFAAALNQAQIPFRQAVERIVADASRSTLSRTAAKQDRSPDVIERGNSSSSQLIQWRYQVTSRDALIIRDLVDATGFFYPDEVAIAEALVVERLAKGDDSGYHFVIAEIDGQVAGYAAYGHIACTRDSYDLYWIAVHPRHQGQGIGRLILEESEKCIRKVGGRRVYIETSNREQYQSTRGFYLRCGYVCEAVLAEFYGPKDDKVIFVKALS